VRRVFSWIAALAVTVGTLAAIGPGTPTAQAAGIPAECQVSPFGNSATWAGLDTVFVDGTTPSGSWSLQNFRMSNTTHDLARAGVVSVPQPGSTQYVTTSSVSADLDGDGSAEIVRASIPTAPSSGTELTPYRHYIPNKSQSKLASLTLPRYQDVAIAAGRFLPASTDTLVPRQQIGVIGRTPSGQIDVRVYGGTSQGLTSTPLLHWSTTRFPFTLDAKNHLVDATFADIDGDGQQEFVAGYVNNLSPGLMMQAFKAGQSSPITEFPVQLTPTSGTFPSSPRHLRIVSGNFDGDPLDEVAAAWDLTDPELPSYSDSIHLVTLNYNGSGLPKMFVATGWRTVDNHPLNDVTERTWDVASADLDNDRMSELVVAYPRSDTELGVDVLAAHTPTMPTQSSWRTTDVGTGSVFHGAAASIAVAAGDQNDDGRDDIGLAFAGKDGDQTVFSLSELPQTSGLTAIGKFHTNQPGRPEDVMVADWDKSSTRTVYTEPPGMPRCVDVDVPSLLSAIDSSPMWRKLQIEGDSYTAIGNGTSQSSGKEYGHTHDFMASVELEGGTSEEAKIEVIPGILEFGGESKQTIISTYEHQNGKTTSAATDKYEVTTTGAIHAGLGRGVSYATVPYRCYYYRAYIVTAQNEYQVFCTLRKVGDKNATETVNAKSWDSAFGPVSATAADSWVPVQPEWANLAIQHSGSNFSASSGAQLSAAADGDPDVHSASTSWRSQREDDPFWQVDLGRSTPLSSVVVFPEALDCSGICVQNPDYPRDVKVFVFDDPSYAGIHDPDQLASKPGVHSFLWAGPALGRVNFQTRVANAEPANGLAKNDPVSGRFVRVQRLGDDTSFGLSEVQVYPADDYLDPTQYPAEVRTIPGNANYFQARVWIPSTRTYKWIWVGGQLIYNGSSSTGVVHPSQGANEGQTWEIERGTDTTNLVETSSSNAYEVGGSVEGSVGLNLLSLTGSETTTGGEVWEDTTAHTSTIGDHFTIYGWYFGLDTSDVHEDEAGWAPAQYRAPDKCTYAFRPFYYRAEEVSNSGVAQHYVTVSDLVTDSGIDRSADLSNCREGIRRRWGVDNAPVVEPFSVSAAPGTKPTIDVAAHATDSDDADIEEHLRVADVSTGVGTTAGDSASTAAGGLASVSGDDTVVYTPPPGFTGTDSFYVRVTDGDLLSARGDSAAGDLGKVTVTVEEPVGPLTNGGFDAPTPAPWTVHGWTVGADPNSHNGSKDAATATDGSYLSQQFKVPSTEHPTLTFWSRVVTTNGSPTDKDTLDVQVIDGSTTTTALTMSNLDSKPFALPGWRPQTIDLTPFAGKVITLKFAVGEATPDSHQTAFMVDDFAVT
jgi:hypothetical protein